MKLGSCDSSGKQSQRRHCLECHKAKPPESLPAIRASLRLCKKDRSQLVLAWSTANQKAHARDQPKSSTLQTAPGPACDEECRGTIHPASWFLNKLRQWHSPRNF